MITSDVFSDHFLHLVIILFSHDLKGYYFPILVTTSTSLLTGLGWGEARQLLSIEFCKNLDDPFIKRLNAYTLIF